MISNDTKDDSFLDNYNLRSQIISLVLRRGSAVMHASLYLCPYFNNQDQVVAKALLPLGNS